MTRERAGQAVSSKDKNAQLRRVEVWFVPTGGVMPPRNNATTGRHGLRRQQARLPEVGAGKQASGPGNGRFRVHARLPTYPRKPF